MNYQEALGFLEELAEFGYVFGLDRINELLRILGNPQDQLKVIHIGGTNGKGSTAAMINEILTQAGFKTGFFSSPHLINYTERMKINGIEIPRERFATLVEKIKPALQKMVAAGHEHPTEFEVSTTLAILYFAEEEVDFALMEVGLGGAIDSTNVVHPLVSVITNVSMDHMDYLGDTLASIAQIKSGIIKKKTKVVTATDSPEVLKIIRNKAKEQQAELLVLGEDFKLEIISSDQQGVIFNYQGINQSYSRLKTTLLGEHQGINGATSLAVIEFLMKLGYEIDEEAIRAGLESVHWPGRLEIIQTMPLTIIDAAHNLAGVNTLKNEMEKLFSYNKLILVIGMLADKEREKVLSVLAPMADILIITKPNSPRVGNWEQIAKFAEQYVDEIEIIPEIDKAVARGLELTNEGDILCITGSIYMIKEARKLLLPR